MAGKGGSPVLVDSDPWPGAHSTLKFSEIGATSLGMHLLSNPDALTRTTTPASTH